MLTPSNDALNPNEYTAYTETDADKKCYESQTYIASVLGIRVGMPPENTAEAIYKATVYQGSRIRKLKPLQKEPRPESPIQRPRSTSPLFHHPSPEDVRAMMAQQPIHVVRQLQRAASATGPKNPPAQTYHQGWQLFAPASINDRNSAPLISVQSWSSQQFAASRTNTTTPHGSPTNNARLLNPRINRLPIPQSSTTTTPLELVVCGSPVTGSTHKL